MCNGIYCDVESYTCEPSPDERRFRESHEKLDYLKEGQRRLVWLIKRRAHYQRNPLGGAMCKEVDMQIYQQTLLISRHFAELQKMVDEFDRELSSSSTTEASTPSPQSSQRQADWEEVMQMAKMSIGDLAYHEPAKSSSNNSSSKTLFKSIYISPSLSSSSSSASTATASEVGSADAHSRKARKTFPAQTPPKEEMIKLRESLKSIEQSPLFTTMPAFESKQHPPVVPPIYLAGVRSSMP
ncbi:hypothetical protein GGI21_001153 [Coemansia aciculifera]|uniref:Uncharacterized protein n=1 Tax=Coemansia aciculifera TaxID=417176 RepID=A0ACC1M9D0_9FUNG|nr:hypothetical protein IWW38_000750 [Coemansia aciculifera]KAJ2910161.1 hypothetical protein GGI21_001153 [Coemansia aciculifera]